MIVEQTFECFQKRLLISYFLSVFRFLISVMYSKAKLAAACAGIVYFLSYVPYMYVAIREEAAGDKIPAWAKSIAVSVTDICVYLSRHR